MADGERRGDDEHERRSRARNRPARATAGQRASNLPERYERRARDPRGTLCYLELAEPLVGFLTLSNGGGADLLERLALDGKLLALAGNGALELLPFSRERTRELISLFGQRARELIPLFGEGAYELLALLGDRALELSALLRELLALVGDETLELLALLGVAPLLIGRFLLELLALEVELLFREPLLLEERGADAHRFLLGGLQGVAHRDERDVFLDGSSPAGGSPQERIRLVRHSLGKEGTQLSQRR